MADIELVIKIPEEEYSDFCERYIGSHNIVINAVCKGTPLPKGHGRLIDAKDVGEYLTLADVPTIIEADKESVE